MTREAFNAVAARRVPSACKAASILGAPYRPRYAKWTRGISVNRARDWPPCAAFGPATSATIARGETPITSHMTRTGNASRWSSMRRNFISVLLRKCAKFFLRSPAPCAGARSCAAGGHSRRSNPCPQAGSPPAFWSVAAIPRAPRRSCARRATEQRESPAPRQSGSAADHCLPAAQSLPLEFVRV